MPGLRRCWPIRRARRACRSRRRICRPTGAGGGRRRARGVLSPTKLDGLMRFLAGAPRSLDGVAVAISEEELLPIATLADGRP